jgi:radical SAM protein with 4Fe4S-binding SPASM domain
MCPRGNMTRKIGNMSIDIFQKIIDQTSGYSKMIWLFHFGDSVFHPQLNQFVDYAKSKDIKTGISTNPTSLSDKIVTRIMSGDIDRITLSLDGINDNTYKYLRGNSVDYNLAEKNVSNLLKKKKIKGNGRPFIEISMIEMKNTEAEVKEFKNRWNIPGIDKIIIKQFKTWDGSDATIAKMARKSQLSDSYRSENSYPCMRPWFLLTILWNGKVVPCCYDYDGKYIIGDVHSQSLEEIWNCDRMIELRRQHIMNNFEDNPLCKNCKEKKGGPAGKYYPFDLSVLRKIGIRNIIGSIRRETR